MKAYIISLALVSAFALFGAPAATALTQDEVNQCNALASSFAPRKAEFDDKSALRDTLATKAEEAGDAWEDAEALRLFSAEHTQAANTAEAEYLEAKAAFETAESEVRALGAALNEDFTIFNTKCVKDQAS